MIYVNERPIDWPEELAAREASWDDEPFAFDSLAVAATEYVAAEVRVEPFWRSLLVMSGAFITAFGFCAWAAFGQTGTTPLTTEWPSAQAEKWSFVPTQCVELFPELPALAQRLSVPKSTGTAMKMRMCNGDSYDLTALINAVLDRLDAASKQ